MKNKLWIPYEINLLDNLIICGDAGSPQVEMWRSVRKELKELLDKGVFWYEIAEL